MIWLWRAVAALDVLLIGLLVALMIQEWRIEYRAARRGGLIVPIRKKTR